MNYQNVYNALIESAISAHGHPKSRNRRRQGFHLHHIQPASFFVGGRKNPDAEALTNLVYLDYRRHFLAHRLLVKIHQHDPYRYRKMIYAFLLMCRVSACGAKYSRVMEQAKIARESDVELQARLRKILADVKKTPEYRIAHLAGIAKRTADPRWRMLNAEAVRRTTSRASWRENHRRVIQEVTSRASWQRNHTEAMKRLAEDPDWQEKHAHVLALVHSDPEIRRRQREGVRRYYSTPESKVTTRLSARKRSADPVWRKKMLAGVERRTACPVWLANVRAANKRTTSSDKWRKVHASIQAKRRKPVTGIPVAGGAQLVFDGVLFAEQAGFHQSGISACCNGRNQVCDGYIWRWSEPGDLAHHVRPLADFKSWVDEAREKRRQPVVGIPVEGGKPILLRSQREAIEAGFHTGISASINRNSIYMGYRFHFASEQEMEANPDTYGEPKPSITPLKAYIGIPVAGGDEILLSGGKAMKAAGFDYSAILMNIAGKIKFTFGYTFRVATAEEVENGTFGEPKPVKQSVKQIIGTPVAGGERILLAGSKAIKAAGFEQAAVSMSCNGKRKSPHRGYTFHFAEPGEVEAEDFGEPQPAMCS